MEGHTQFVCVAASLAQDFCCVFRARTELAGQRQGCAIAGYSNPYNDREVFGIAGFLKDLVQFLHRVGDEDAYAELMIGALDGAAILHRVQERHAGAGKLAVDQFDLRQGCRVEAAYAGFPQGFKHMLARIGFHRIERLAREFLPEPFCRCRDPLWAETPYGKVRLCVGHNIIGSSIGVHDT